MFEVVFWTFFFKTTYHFPLDCGGHPLTGEGIGTERGKRFSSLLKAASPLGPHGFANHCSHLAHALDLLCLKSHKTNERLFAVYTFHVDSLTPQFSTPCPQKSVPKIGLFTKMIYGTHNYV